MPGVSDVQILHGPQEYGKDIIFWTIGPLGELLPCACVVKNNEITGSVDSNQGARTVCSQAEQALDTPFLDAFGQEQKVHRVYVVSPASISPIAMNSIRGRLSIRSGQIVFVSGNQLFELFRTHWPNFFADEFSSLEAHLRQLETPSKNSALQEVANLYGIEGPKSEAPTIYVNRSLHHSIPMVDFDPQTLLPIPDRDRLAKPWSKADIQEILSRVHQLSTSIPHLERWSFISSDAVDTLLQSIKKFGRDLEQAWLSSASAESGRFDTHGHFALRDIDTLAFAGNSLIDALSQALLPLQQACQLSRSIINEDLCLETLFTPEALAVTSLDDCLRSAPSILLSPSTQRTVEFSEKVVRNSSIPLMIVGSAGCGKTSFCRWNALLDAQYYRSGSSRVFPVYIPLHSLAQCRSTSPEEAFFMRIGASALLPQGTVTQFERIRLYLDGLDEVPSATQRQHLIELAYKAHTTHSNVQIIMTSRDYINASWLSWIPRLSISDLDDRAQEELLQRWLGDTPRLLRSFKKQILQTGTLSELMKVPLLATLTILVFRQTGSLPENRARLYSNFVDLLSGGWDLAKGVLRVSRFGLLVKVMVLSNLANKAHWKKVRYFDGKLIGAAVKSVLNEADKKTILEFTSELLIDGVISRSADKYFFSHLSFQEFLCAKQMLGVPDTSTVERALLRYLNGDDWWHEVLRFYITLSENPLALADWLFPRLNQGDDRAQEIWKFIEVSFPGFRLSSWIDARVRAAH